ncbi:hypothetical protein D3C73_616850 [compost metagenome]
MKGRLPTISLKAWESIPIRTEAVMKAHSTKVNLMEKAAYLLATFLFILENGRKVVWRAQGNFMTVRESWSTRVV